MTRTQILQLIVVALLLVFVGVWFYTKQSLITTAPVASVAVAPPVVAPAAATPEVSISSPTMPQLEEVDLDSVPDPLELSPLLKEALLERQLARERQKQLQKKHVPTQAPAPIQPPPLQLQGVLWGTARPQAIINRRIVSVGDTIEGATIVAVSREGVKISFSGEEFKLKLPQRGALDAHSKEGEENR